MSTPRPSLPTVNTSDDALAHLTASPSRVLIPLSPRSGNVPLPPIGDTGHSSTAPVDAQSSESPPNASDASQHALIDFAARSARFEPRLRRYAQRKLLSSSSGATVRVADPITAFSNAAGSSQSPTPRALTSSAGSHGPSHPRSRGFSLVDIERALLSLAPGWWKNRSEKSAAADKSDEHDDARFDVDLSGVLDDSFGSSGSATPATSSSSDSASAIPSDKGTRLFLDYYTSEQMVQILESSGIIDSLYNMGYTAPSLIFDTSDDIQHRMSLVDPSLYDGALGLRSTDRFLIDLYMKRRRQWNMEHMVVYQLTNRLQRAGGWDELREMTGELRAPYVSIVGAREIGEFLEQSVPKYSKSAKRGQGVWEVTEIVWMQAHDPKSKDDRPLLPGQRFPGLGLGRRIGELMEKLSKESNVTDGMLNFPFYWHLAVAYAARGWRHLDPIMEAYVEFVTAQMQPYVEEHGLAFVAWAITLGHMRRITEELVDENDNPAGQLDPSQWKTVRSRLERWTPAEQLFATSDSMSQFLGGKEWTSLYNKWQAVFKDNGGASSAVSGPSSPLRKRARLVLDLEGCPELWKYSKIWSKRDPETGEFR